MINLSHFSRLLTFLRLARPDLYYCLINSLWLARSGSEKTVGGGGLSSDAGFVGLDAHWGAGGGGHCGKLINERFKRSNIYESIMH